MNNQTLIDNKKPEYAVFIDFLAFTTPVSAFKDIHTYQKKGFEWRKYPAVPDPRNFKPESFADESIGLTPEQSNNYMNALTDCYYDRLKVFLSDFFGLTMGVPRGRGGHFYDNSASLYSYDGNYDSLGTVYFGGNKDTVYIQISGKGCAHVFSYTTPEEIHNILNFLDITTLKRLDLATDDYTGIFSCNAALRDYKDDAFYVGHGPKPCIETAFAISADGEPTKEIVTVGSRRSRTYWRIYNKALEQKVTGIWYRSEVELKEMPTDILLNISGTYTGICAYSSQINIAKPQKINKGQGRKAVDSIENAMRWIRKQGSKTLAKVFHLVEGDTSKFIDLLIQREHLNDLNLQLDIPIIYQDILREKLNISPAPF
ncbi:TPA: replication initiation factor domain-containing protein [Providencia rettgeri]|nr:replication initiation factor domain-containing protein [Providencia rettgeri]HEM8269031.1 replication initiation factor domain-containing protein [Providencia rettgeri]